GSGRPVASSFGPGSVMLDVSNGVGGLARRVPEREAGGQALEARINEKMKMAYKIDDLFNCVRPFQTAGPGQMGRDSLSDVLSGMPKDLFPEPPESGNEKTRKAAGRN